MVNEVRAAIPSLRTLLDRDREASFRISDESTVERDILVCSNGVVDLEYASAQSTTADLFATTALPFAFDPMAKTSDTWLAFLSDIGKASDPLGFFGPLFMREEFDVSLAEPDGGVEPRPEEQVIS